MSEDVSKFLAEVKQLGDRRAEEDEARSRELEERILQDRKERQARRAERARSISPQKSSPANTPPPSAPRTSTTQASQNSILQFSPDLEAPASPTTAAGPSKAETMEPRALFSNSASKENESPFDSENKRGSNTMTPTRSDSVARGLSWQRRPNSQASNGSRSRPLSMVAAENAARSSTTPSEPKSATEPVSRDQIAQALSAKDPSWFRQTADRGTSSGAYRKNQVEDEERLEMSSMRAQLPGMSRSPSAEPVREETNSRPEPLAFGRTLGSPLSLTSSSRLDPPRDDFDREPEATLEKEPSMPPPSDRASPPRSERPVSPTKGMGGFVQSAMMKRSDSVNKRWSVKSPEGLQRVDSVASGRGGLDSIRTKSRPTSFLRENSVEGSFEPTSTRGRQNEPAEESISRKISDSLRLDTKSTPDPVAPEEDKTTPPISPSKTMDSRRWSPTKASWLESALNKPESPKPKPTPPPSNQPAWMAEIAKAKAQKATSPDAESAKTPTISHKHQVSIGGLMRSSAPGIGAKPAQLQRGNSPSTPTITTNRTGYGGPRNNPLGITPGAGDSKASAGSDRDSGSTPASDRRSKPETPPKKDFRTNLKPRQPPPSSGGSETPEFKNVFGSLRKTTTQNYVAPDELKGNILRGKAALNLTGGPKKTDRKDEFKEAILAKKKEFQQVQTEGRGITRTSSNASETVVPEGLAKKLELDRSNTIKRESTSSDVEPTRTPTLRKEASAPGQLQGKSAGNALANRFNPALAGLLARGPPTVAKGPSSDEDASPQTAASASLEDDAAPSSGPKLTHMTKSRARGPKRKAPTASSATISSPGASPAAGLAPSPNDSGEQPQTAKVELRTPAVQKPASPTVAAKPQIISLVDSSKRIYESSSRPMPQPISLVHSPRPAETQTQAAAARTPSPVKGHTRTKSRVFEQVAAFASQTNPASPTKEVEQLNSQPPSPRKLDTKRISKFFDEHSKPVIKSPVREAPQDTKLQEDPTPQPLFSRSKVHIPHEPEVRSPPPIIATRPLPVPGSSLAPQPPVNDSVDSESTVSVKAGASIFGGRALPSTAPSEKSTPVKPRPLPLEPQSSRPIPSPGFKSPPPAASPMRSPTKQATEITNVLNEFFGPDRPKRNYHVDTADILMRRPSVSPPRIRTLNAQLFQLSADGKKVPVPSHLERVLFEREMYLCSHTFSNEAGKKTSEVYFWTGDDVHPSAVEDASVFVAREARALGGRVIRLQQGRETSEFIAALGGIVITRRGSSNKYDSLAPHMMCGRRYLGQIVFDEVDYSPAALCSGFPYLVTASGRCHLWKGKGSGVDELSCARLIGMDYALSGEMEEIEDGRETAAFWDLFNNGSKSGSADHWRLKPNYDKYCGRLFYSDIASKQQIVELSPFSQRDLQPSGIYVLDAFFELYIVVGKHAQSQYAAFHNALDFAQEYAILAAGMEDRPFVPVSTVVLEGIPRDLKSVFRKWRDQDSPTVLNPPGSGTGLRRGRSLRIVPLTQALQALSE